MLVYTVGHSTRTAEEFLHLLSAHGVTCLLDVRKIPRSGHNPQFGGERLAAALGAAAIEYRHMPGLGGLRRPRPDSINKGWRNTGFRGFADYMQTAEFQEHLDACIDLARRSCVALMCAEAVPWRCHRSLIADALIVRGIEVREISSATSARRRALTPWAHVSGHAITYPESDTSSAHQARAGRSS
jgi:uncharacterized protein (DUF488 family)